MNLSKVVALATAVVVALSFPMEAEAKKRLGGGGSMGMQRSAPAKTSPNSPPAQQASPAQNSPAGTPQAAPQPAAAAAPMAAAAPAAAAAQKRSWMGPIAGLAAGLGINAGHDLNRDNLPAFVQAVPGLQEVSISHALIGDALELGYAATVQAYLRALA